MHKLALSLVGFMVGMLTTTLQAQIYLVDDNFVDSAKVYSIGLNEEKTVEIPRNVAFKLPMGEKVVVERVLKGNSGYAAVRFDGTEYAMSSHYLLFSEDNPEGTEDLFGDTRERTNHSTMGKFFATMTPYWFVIILFVTAIVFTFLGLSYAVVRRPALFVVPICIFLASLIEIWAACVMGNDAFWWCDKDIYGFWGSLFRALPFMLFVAFQLYSIKLYKSLLLKEIAEPDKELSLKPLGISVAICLPSTILVAIICSVAGMSEILFDILTTLAFFVSLGIGVFISSKKNIAVLGKTAGIAFSLFGMVYFFGAVIAIYGLVVVLIRLIVQILMIVAAIVGVFYFMSQSSGSSNHSQPTMMYRDEDGHLHNNSIDAESANKRIAERKSNDA